MFHHQRKNPLAAATKSLKDLVRYIPASQFLAEEKRQILLLKIKELVHMDDSQYTPFCAVLIENLVNYCQNLPETKNSYYSQPGGLVDYALNRTEAALGLFEEFIIQEPSESISEEQKQWQYALFSAAILQGIGKLYVDYHIHQFDNNGHLLKQWNPLSESLNHTGSFYHYEFQKEPEVEFRRRLNLLLAHTLMPAKGFDWIASNPQILAVWLALLNEDEGGAGTLGAILIRADSIAIQRYIAEYMGRISAHRAGRYGRSGTFSGGVPETLIEKEQNAGLEFIQWVQKALDEGRIMINKAPLFMVPGGMLMCQEMFALFVREHPEYKNWQAVKNGFLSLGLHKRSIDGSALSRFEHAQSRQMYDGVVFSSYGIALPESVKVMQSDMKTVETMSALELTHKALHSSQLIQQNAMAALPMQNLSAKGTWEIAEPSTHYSIRSNRLE